MTLPLLWKTKLWAILIMGFWMSGFAALVWARTAGHLSLTGFRIGMPLHVVGCVLAFVFIRRRAKADYAVLPVDSQMEVVRGHLKVLRRQTFWIKAWWCWLPFAIILTQQQTRDDGIRLRIFIAGLGVMFFVYSVIWFRAIKKASKALAEKLQKNEAEE